MCPAKKIHAHTHMAGLLADSPLLCLSYVYVYVYIYMHIYVYIHIYLCVYVSFLFFLGHKSSLQAQNCQNPLSLALLQIVDKTNSCSAPAITGKGGKGMLYVQWERRGSSGEKGKSTEEVSPFTGKAHCHGGAVPSEGCNREFLGISLTQPVSIPRMGTLSPVSLWDVGRGCFGG